MSDFADNQAHIFISHRRIDKAVADEFRKANDSVGNGVANVWQSSNAKHSSCISDNLDDSIAKAISISDVIMLIYTEASGEMDWCMT